MRRLLLVPVVLALTVSVLQADIRRSQTPPAAAQSAGFPAIAAPIVTLVSTGAEPRKALRYSVPAGSTIRTAIDTNMAMTMEMMGMSMPEMKLPTMKMVAEFAVSAVAANGDMTFSSGVSSLTFDTAGVDPTIAAAMASANTDVSSIKTTGTMSNRGITNQQLDISKIADPQLKQMMETAGAALQSMSFPLPDEAVGVGGRWEIRQRMAAGGVETMTTQTVEVMAIAGSKVTLKITTDQTAPPQPMKNPALPPDAEVNLVKMTGTGTSTTVLDLATLANQGEGTMTMSMAMAVKMQGMEQNMSMITGLTIKTAPVK
jgi:hypothetical protein